MKLGKERNSGTKEGKLRKRWTDEENKVKRRGGGGAEEG